MPRVARQELSPRELEVLGWAAEGKSCAETAMILFIGEGTVVFHRRNAVRKLDVCNMIQAVAVAIRRGLI